MTASASDPIERVEAELTGFVQSQAAALAELGEDVEPLVDAARRIALGGGKRLRPQFAYWGWRTVRGASDDDRALVTAAAALELLHACALVHDDVMDASATRRGRPAARTAFADRHREQGWSGDPVAFGDAAAIVLGDLLHSWSDALFARAPIEPAHLPGAREVFDRMRTLVMAGQYLDVLVQARAAFSPQEALRVVEFKTSKYTVEGPLHLGAALAGAPAETLATLSAYGLALGEAFQLRDDVLGVFGDPDETGKPAGDDLREGKQTLLTALALANADAAQAALLRADLGDRDLDTARVDALRAVIVATGALERVEARITASAARARAALTGGGLSPATRDALDALVGAATQRRT